MRYLLEPHLMQPCSVQPTHALHHTGTSALDR